MEIAHNCKICANHNLLPERYKNCYGLIVMKCSLCYKFGITLCGTYCAMCGNKKPPLS